MFVALFNTVKKALVKLNGFDYMAAVAFSVLCENSDVIATEEQADAELSRQLQTTEGLESWKEELTLQAENTEPEETAARAIARRAIIQIDKCLQGMNY